MSSEDPSATDHDFEQVLKVSVLRSGELLLEGDPATMGALEVVMAHRCPIQLYADAEFTLVVDPS